MRVIVIKQPADLKVLRGMLSQGGSGTPAATRAGVTDATIERIKALNPHVDLHKIRADTVLLLPDSPELERGDSRPIGDDALSRLSAHFESGFKAIGERMRTSEETAAADAAALAKALKSAVIARQAEADPVLKKQLDRAAESSSAERKKAQATAKQVKLLGTAAADELRALRKLFR